MIRILEGKIKQCVGPETESRGFALPTVLILSIVLLAIGVSTLQLGAAISRSLIDQHWNHLAKVTAQAGVTFISSCADKGAVAWQTNLTPLKTCNESAMPAPSSLYVASSAVSQESPSKWRSTYTIAPPVIGNDDLLRARVTGIVEVLSTSGAVARTYTWNYNAVYNVKKIAKISQGDYQSCALTNDQLIYCVGYNGYGQLGDATAISRTSVVQYKLPAGKFAADVNTVSTFFTCALTTDQLIYCAGRNDNGQLGDSSTTNRSTPVLFQLPVGKTAIKVIPTTYQFTCALTVDQLVYCAGINDFGQLGDNSTTTRSTPVLFQLPAGKSATAIATSQYTTCALTADQLVYCSGQNNVGQLSDTTAVNRTVPVLFQLPAGKSAQAVSAGWYHTCVLANDQQVYCSGFNAYGQLGIGSTANQLSAVRFQLPAGKLAASVIATSPYQTCVLTTDQLVYCSGYNGYGQMGDGTTTDRLAPFLFPLPGGRKALSISPSPTNLYHNCVVATDYTVYCAGYNPFGALGDGSITNRSTPVLFQLPASEKAVSVNTSYYQSCVLTIELESYCAGYNDFGELGNNSVATNQTTPVKFLLR